MGTTQKRTAQSNRLAKETQSDVTSARQITERRTAKAPSARSTFTKKTPSTNQNDLTDLAELISPDAMERLRAEHMVELVDLWHNYANKQPFDLTDRRFLSPEWHTHLWANYAAKSYLINARLLHDMAECVQTDEKTKTRVRFSVMQWIDSMAPSNFFLTNPDVQKKLLESNGDSLTLGIQNFMADLQRGRISQTDESAFEVGVNVAQSVGAVIFENEYFQLLQYAPLTDQVHERPLLIVPPCINKFYILDLQPDNSFVRHAVEMGQTVYLVSWRNADESLAQATWDDYIEHAVIRAIHLVQSLSKQKQINVLGFCVGGTLLGTALAVLASRGEQAVASVTFLTTLLDFSDNGVLDALVDEQQVLTREKAFANGGVMQGRELANAFSLLRPADLVWSYVVNNYLKGEKPMAFDLLYWNSDGTNLPGPLFSWYLRNTYLENNLKDKSALQVCGEPLDLSSIDVPHYVLSCREDHIVPWASAYRSAETIRGQRRFILAASGHIAGVINSVKRNKRSYWVREDTEFKGNAQAWLNDAVEQPGSWWSDWSDWLNAYSGKKIKAPAQLGSKQYTPIEAAPGRYVKERLA